MGSAGPTPAPGRLLEHLNLNVPDSARAARFYADGLGAVPNPKIYPRMAKRLIHVNVGHSQVHMPVAPVAQVWRGHAEFATEEPLHAVEARLRAAGEAVVRAAGGAELRAACPWGNEYRIVPAAAAAGRAALAARGGHPGGIGALTALAQAVHRIAPGAAAAAAGFYRNVLRIDARMVGAPAAAGAARCEVPFAADGLPPQRLVFEESGEAGDPAAYDADGGRCGYHVAMYLATHDHFVAAFRRAEAAGLLYANPRFNETIPTLADAEKAAQFRVKDMRDPETGRLALVLEHEVRSPRSRLFPLRATAASL